MKKREAKTGFKTTKDKDLLAIGSTVIAAMKNNPDFVSADPEIAEVSIAVGDYSEKLDMVNKKGSPYDTSLKEESKLKLAALLKRLAFYVNTVADGSLPIILSSGFPITGISTAATVAGIPERLKLRDWQQSGQVRFDFDPVLQAWMYEYVYTKEVAEDGSIVWPDEVLTTTKSSGNILSPMVPREIYYVRARSRNGQGISDWSEPVSIIAR